MQDEVKEVMQILRDNGIRMAVGGCGCCGSPWVTFEHDCKTILDDESVIFDMFQED